MASWEIPQQIANEGLMMMDDTSMSNPGVSEDAPYVPSWCFDGGVAPMCSCGDHSGYHNDAGECLKRERCGCTRFSEVVDVKGVLITPADDISNIMNKMKRDIAASCGVPLDRLLSSKPSK